VPTVRARAREAVAEVKVSPFSLLSSDEVCLALKMKEDTLLAENGYARWKPESSYSSLLYGLYSPCTACIPVYLLLIFIIDM